VSGWQRPAPPDEAAPRSHWSQRGSDPFGPGQLIRKGWRLYRSAPRRLLIVAFISGLLQTVAVLPSLVWGAAMARGMFDVMADYFDRVLANPEAYRFADQQALQAELQERLRSVLVPLPDPSAVTTIGSGLGGAVGLIGTAALTAVALSIAAGRPIPVPFAFRLVAARAGLVKPIVALGLGWAAISWLSTAIQASPDVQTWAGAAGSPRSLLIGSLLSVLAAVVAVGIIVLAVRWALFVPAVLVEALGVGPGLARAAQLTRGIRIRLGLAMAGILLLEGLVIAIVATIAGVVVGLSAGSFDLGFATYVGVGLIGNVLWAPWLPAVFAAAYREKTHGVEPSGVPAPGGEAPTR
jgi:hypothetical protein